MVVWASKARGPSLQQVKQQLVLLLVLLLLSQMLGQVPFLTDLRILRKFDPALLRSCATVCTPLQQSVRACSVSDDLCTETHVIGNGYVRIQSPSTTISISLHRSKPLSVYAHAHHFWYICMCIRYAYNVSPPSRVSAQWF